MNKANSTPTKYTAIKWEIKENIGHLILCQPPPNKMDSVFFDDFKNLLNHNDSIKDIDAIIVYGQGRHFSSGADLADLLANISENTRINSDGKITNKPHFLKENLDCFLHFENLNIPIIAAIKGVCLGSALELALFCHFRLCGENAVLGFPETTFNLMPGCGGTSKLPAIAGKSKALELLLTGSNFSSEEALDWNIVDKIVLKKNIVETAISFAKKISKGYNKNQKQYYLKKFL